MQVTLIGKESTYKKKLPEEVKGNYWITDNGAKKLLNIQANSGFWQVRSNTYAKIINSKYVNISEDYIKTIPSAERIVGKTNLKEYGIYCIEIGNTHDLYLLYCSPDNEKKSLKLNISNLDNIKIGKNLNNQITYRNKLIKDVHARIFSSNGRWMIENYDHKFGTFVNNIPVKNMSFLFNGDTIFLMGLEIVFSQNSLFMNNPKNRVICQERKIINQQKQQDTIKIETSMQPIEQIKKQKTNRDSMFLISTIAMVLVIIVAMSQVINGIINEEFQEIKTIFFIGITFLMIICMLVFFIMELKYEKKKKKYRMALKNQKK